MATITKYRSHPAADIFPMMIGDAFEALKRDIDENGVKECITIFNELIIDGRNRHKAMVELGIDPACHAAELEECDDPVSYVLSLNLHRRHLSEAQRSMVAAKIANMKRGDNQHKKEDVEIPTTSQQQAADMLNVSRDSVNKAKHAIDNGSASVVAAVETGGLAVSVAAKFVDVVTDKKQQEKIASGGADAIKAAMKDAKPKKSKPAEPEAASETVEDAKPMEPNAIGKFKTLWKSWSAAERRSIRLWILEETGGS